MSKNIKLTDTDILLAGVANLLEMYNRVPDNPGKADIDYKTMFNMPDKTADEMKAIPNNQLIENIQACTSYLYIRATPR